MIARLLAFLARQAMPMLGLGVLAGIAWPSGASSLHRHLAELVFLLTVGAFLGVDWPSLLAYLRRPGLLAAATAWKLLAVPVTVAAVVQLLPLPPALAQAMVLWAACAPLISSAPLALLLGLDPALALIVTVLGLVAMPFTVPILALELLGIPIEIGVLPLMARLAGLVLGAAILAAILRPLLQRPGIAPTRVEIGGLNVLLLFVFSVGVMGGAGELVAARPGDTAIFVAATAAEAALLFGLTALVFLPAGRRIALTLGLCTCFSNFAIVWAALGDAAGADFMLFFLAIQFPIYLLPIVFQPVLRRLRGSAPGQESLVTPRTSRALR